MIVPRLVRFAYILKLSRCTYVLRPVLFASASLSTHIEGGSVAAPNVATRAQRLRASGVLTRAPRRALFQTLGNVFAPQVQTLPKRRLQFSRI